MKYSDIESLFDPRQIETISPIEIDPLTYEDSLEHDAVEDLENRLVALMEQSAKKQRRINIAMVVIGALTLIATVAGVVLQLAG